MDARFVVRVLDESYALLGWAEVVAQARPQARGPSCPFWPTDPITLTMIEEGRASYLAIHWTDLNLARLQAIGPVPVTAGQTMTLAVEEPIWTVSGGQHDVPLPPVTMSEPVTIGVPTARMGARAPR